MSLVAEHTLALAGLRAAIPGLEVIDDLLADLASATDRGVFRPPEEERLWSWFARLLTVRSGLWELMEEADGSLEGDPNRVRTREEWRVFLVAYAAACEVVRLDRLLVERVAAHRLVQRKLNEGERAHRIPRRTFTAIFRSLADPRNAWRMEQAMMLRAREADLVDALADDVACGVLVRELPELERALDPSRLRYLGLWFRYRLHSLRRRAASGRQQGLFALLETSGRTAAEIRDRRRPRRITAAAREAITTLLRPGDVLVTRQEGALTNLFLPGFWPHVALYLGTEAQRAEIGLELPQSKPPQSIGERAQDPMRVLEARADGVRLRPIAETLAVDAVAVIRPLIEPAEVAAGIERALAHEGKLYNFDFDFFRADRLVCTEVIYRGFDGVGGLELPLRARAGRPTLAAEDLLDLALDGRSFEVVLVFGTPTNPDTLATGDAARSTLAASYRRGSKEGPAVP